MTEKDLAFLKILMMSSGAEESGVSEEGDWGNVGTEDFAGGAAAGATGAGFAGAGFAGALGAAAGNWAKVVENSRMSEK